MRVWLTSDWGVAWRLLQVGYGLHEAVQVMLHMNSGQLAAVRPHTQLLKG